MACATCLRSFLADHMLVGGVSRPGLGWQCVTYKMEVPMNAVVTLTVLVTALCVSISLSLVLEKVLREAVFALLVRRERRHSSSL